MISDWLGNQHNDTKSNNKASINIFIPKGIFLLLVRYSIQFHDDEHLEFQGDQGF
jgi:hypothetical protein